MYLYHRAWTSVCKYVLKEEKEPLVWGKQSSHQIKDSLKALEMHRKLPERNQWIVQRLSTFDEWEQVYQEPEIVKRLFSSVNSVKSVFEDLKVLKEREGCLHERFVSYLQERGWPEEYTVQQSKEKYFLLDWIATNVIFGRPIRKKLLLLYGELSTQKTKLLEMIDQVLNIYHASTRNNDFKGVHYHYYLWLFD